MKWTKSEVSLLIAMVKNGKHNSNIAREMKRPKNSISGKIFSLQNEGKLAKKRKLYRKYYKQGFKVPKEEMTLTYKPYTKEFEAWIVGACIVLAGVIVAIAVVVN